MASHSATKTLNAIVHNNSWTTRPGFVFLAAEVFNPDTGIVLPIITGERNRHDRLETHFGLYSAQLVALSSEIDVLPEGATLEEAVRALWQRVVDLETLIRHFFLLDAEVALDVFWIDDFTRVEVSDLGRTTGWSRFGQTDWQRVAGEDLDVSVDGAEAVFEPLAADSFVDYVGYPTVTTGEIYFELFVPELAASTTVEWGFDLFPFRDDVSQADILVRLFRSPIITPHERLRIALGTSHYDTASGSAIWLAFRIQFAPVGGDIKFRTWHRDFEPEPSTWDLEATHSAGSITLVDQPRLEIYSIDNDPGIDQNFRVDNLRMQKTDTDPARIYHEFSLDAYVPGTITYTQTFVADAIAKAKVNATRTLDAIAKRNRTGSVVADAIALRNRTGSFTLDAWMPGAAIGDPYDAASGYNVGIYDGDGTPFWMDAMIAHVFTQTFTLEAEVAAPDDSLYDSPTDTYTAAGQYDN
jgi:hypothetical protein